ncbi:MAG TPA: TRAP transporter large permease subunit, partial [Deltaproteobacteria bacterium]|nr:TRAP transporter large permease subunit [Deltaproteobacteria bacterium]
AIFCTNLVIGLATPPFGIVLFVTSPIAKVTIEETFKYAWPMIAASIGVLLIMTFFPQTVLWLPRLFGY